MPVRTKFGACIRAGMCCVKGTGVPSLVHWYGVLSRAAAVLCAEGTQA